MEIQFSDGIQNYRFVQTVSRGIRIYNSEGFVRKFLLVMKQLTEIGVLRIRC